MQSSAERDKINSKLAKTASFAMAFGIASIVMALLIPVVGFVFALVAMLLGGISLESSRRNSATTAIALGGVVIALTPFYILTLIYSAM